MAPMPETAERHMAEGPQLRSGIPKSPPRGRHKAARGPLPGSHGGPQGLPGEANARPPGAGGKPAPGPPDEAPARPVAPPARRPETDGACVARTIREMTTMNASMPSPRGEPDPLDDVAKVAEVAFRIDELLFGRAAGNPPPGADMPGGLVAAERELFWWEMCERFLRLLCTAPAKCADLRCRRSKCCRKLGIIALAVEDARLHFGAERAKLPPPAPQPVPPARKKGRAAAGA